MELWTVHNARHAKVKDAGIRFLDCTVMTGAMPFAPDPKHLRAYKAGELSERAYTALYRSLMATSMLTYPRTWKTVLEAEKVAIGCVCGAGKYCHRYLLVSIIRDACKKKGVTFSYQGEFGDTSFDASVHIKKLEGDIYAQKEGRGTSDS